jgi:uncharacterized protein
MTTVFGTTLLLQGCAGSVSPQQSASYDSLLAQGNYSGAASFAQTAGKIAPDGTSSNLLWSLNAGAAMTYAGDAAHTIPVLDHAEDMMNAYKAISAMQGGRKDIARTELLRSDDRERRAEEELQAEEAKAKRSEADHKDFDFQGALKAAQSDATLVQVEKDMANYGHYKAFINPFATYLTGLYYLNAADSEPEKARKAFQEVRGMAPSALLNSDYALAAKGGKFSPKTWVIFENGQGMTLAQYNVSFPVPIVGRHTGVSVATVALPRLQVNGSAAQALLVGDKGERTTLVGDFDQVMGSEFNRRYPSIIRNAVLEAALKVVLMNVAAQEKSGIALLAATVVSNVSVADVRSWSALPKNFQAARIETPKDGTVRLRTDAGVDLGTAQVPTDVSSIVYVKQERAGSPPAIQVLRF